MFTKQHEIQDRMDFSDLSSLSLLLSSKIPGRGVQHDENCSSRLNSSVCEEVDMKYRATRFHRSL